MIGSSFLAIVACLCALTSSVEGARRRGSKLFNDISGRTPDQHHLAVQGMSNSGQHMTIIAYLEDLMKHVEHLNFDDRLPSLYSYLGVAYHDATRTEDAIAAFKNCTLYHQRNPDPRLVLKVAESELP